jgi:release factor glutamine methyltransferase
MAQDSAPFSDRLIHLLGPDEGRAVFREICRELYPEMPSGNWQIPEDDRKVQLKKILSGLEEGKPFQYLLGKAHFMGLELSVNPSVLIPRPETEELVFLILQSRNNAGKKVLDLCTGSGCIALALAAKASYSSVEGLDVSPEALKTATANAQNLGSGVSFFSFDLLQDVFEENARWDIWVSNPPYVAASESAGMDKRVLDHEPHLALFVPDEDSLCFYRRILQLSEKHLNQGGEIFLELNPHYSEELCRIYRAADWIASAEIMTDMSGKQRFLVAVKKSQD